MKGCSCVRAVSGSAEEEDLRARIGMAKAAFWQNKELIRRIIRFST
jgi:hypothetical protein